MLSEIVAFILGFISAVILFLVLGYKQKKKLEQLSKNFDISLIKGLIEKSKEDNNKRMGGDINEKREN